jgi:ribosomal protein S12 methylthiotransferase RimO
VATETRSVYVETLGCARNDVDSEELAARLIGDGWILVDTAEGADAVVVNTCGFVDVAKKDSIDAVLAAAEYKDESSGPIVVAVGCLAERYGAELAESLPEADAVLGFDDYADIGNRLRSILAGEPHVPHAPRDRRQLLPISPVDRAATAVSIPGHGDSEVVPGWTPPVLRKRLDGSPVAPVKLASGCDRRCTFCAIPSFRGSFISRPPADVLAEIAWLVDEGVREVVLVSENSTSYGKDLGDIRLLESLLPAIGEGTAITRARVAYLQPAEVRPGLLDVMARTEVVAPYFDLSFQHASPKVLRRMRRFGGLEEFCELVDTIRRLDPEAGIRSNVIVGFPGEEERDVEILVEFLERARLDAIGVFGYSDEEGTEAFTFTDKVPIEIVDARVKMITTLAEELMAQRAEDRIGSIVEVLIEEVDTSDGGWVSTGRAGHQGPDDAESIVRPATGASSQPPPVGSIVRARVTDCAGLDLLCEQVAEGE